MTVRGGRTIDVIACGARSLVFLMTLAAIALAQQIPADAAWHVTALDATLISSPSRNNNLMTIADACTGRVIGDDPTSSRHTCCCHTASQIACEPTEQCAAEHGSCLRGDWGVCHFPSLNQKTIRR